MAQDLGSALLAGFQAAQSMGQQRFNNELAQDQLALDKRRLGIQERNAATAEATAEQTRIDNERKREGEDADQWMESNYMFLDDTRLNIDKNKLRSGIEAGDQQAIDIALDVVNRSTELPEGSKAVGIRPLDGGGYAIDVINADNSPGVITEDGSSGPNSIVVNFTPGKLSGLANYYYRTKIASRSSRFSPSTMSALVNLTEAEQADYELMRRETAVANTVPKEGGASRAVANVIAESDLEGTKADVVGMIENDIGVAPQPGRQQNRASAQNSAGADVAEDDVYRFEDFTPEELDQVKTEYGKLGMDPLPINRGPEAFNRIPMEKRKALFDAIRTRRGDAATASATASATDDNNGIERLIELEAANQSGPRRRRGGPIPDSSELTQLRSQYSPKEVEAYQLRKRVNRRGRKDSQWQAEKERLTQLESEIAAEKQSAIAPDDPALAEQLTAFADEIADLPPEEIDEGVANGKIKVSSEVASAVADKLQENNIRNVRDLKGLNIRDRALARAVVIASPGVPDQIRIRYAQEMSNLFETGVPSISAAQAEINRIEWAKTENSNANTRLREAEFNRSSRNDSVEQEGKVRKIITDNTEKGVGFLQQTRDIFQPEDDKGRRPSRPILTRDRANAWVTQALPEQLYEIDASPTKFERGRLIKAMNQGISYTLAALASDGDAGLKEAFLSWFRPNTEGNVNPADFDIQRVRMVTNNSGNPVSFYYVDARGNRTGTAVPARAVQNISEDLYQALFEAANHYGSEQE